MEKQLEFTTTKNKKTRKKLAPECARKMIAILAVKAAWVKRLEIMQAYGWKADRLCRLGCEGSHGRIIFGQDGYKLTRLATLNEIDICSATILSQIQALQKKHSQLIRRRHNYCNN